MKKYIYIAAAILVLGLLATIGIQRANIRGLKVDRDAYKTTAEAALRGTEHYKTEAGLNAAKVQEQQLTLKEYERYRAEDAALISSLRVKLKNADAVVKSQTETIYELKTKGRDSIIINKETHTVDTVRVVTYDDEWLHFAGFFDKDWNFTGEIKSREELIYVESITYKRFLGFLWNTKKVLKREQDIVSRNPHTVIRNMEFTTLRK